MSIEHQKQVYLRKFGHQPEKDDRIFAKAYKWVENVRKWRRRKGDTAGEKVEAAAKAAKASGMDAEK